MFENCEQSVAFRKLVDVIDSCKTLDQLETAKNCIAQFAKHFPHSENHVKMLEASYALRHYTLS